MAEYREALRELIKVYMLNGPMNPDEAVTAIKGDLDVTVQRMRQQAQTLPSKDALTLHKEAMRRRQGALERRRKH